VTITLRPMRWWDFPAVMALERDLFGAEAWSDAMFWGELAERATRHYVVAVAVAVAGGCGDDRGEVVGYAGLCAYPPHEAYVQTIAVAGPCQGAGIGARLLDDLIEEADRRDCRHLDLEVRADNLIAIGFYERRGFTRLGTRRGYYQPSGVDAVVMRREARR
jgi:[ribosomal protein S18]-alanine N-acetyltransferase